MNLVIVENVSPQYTVGCKIGFTPKVLFWNLSPTLLRGPPNERYSRSSLIASLRLVTVSLAGVRVYCSLTKLVSSGSTFLLDTEPAYHTNAVKRTILHSSDTVQLQRELE